MFGLQQPTGGLKWSSLQLGVRVGGHPTLTNFRPDDPKRTLAYPPADDKFDNHEFLCSCDINFGEREMNPPPPDRSVSLATFRHTAFIVSWWPRISGINRNHESLSKVKRLKQLLISEGNPTDMDLRSRCGIRYS